MNRNLFGLVVNDCLVITLINLKKQRHVGLLTMLIATGTNIIKLVMVIPMYSKVRTMTTAFTDTVSVMVVCTELVSHHGEIALH